MKVDECSTKLQVLLIEDNSDDAELLMESLRNGSDHGLAICWVPMLKTAFDTLTKSYFDAVLLDLSLPDSSGIDSLLRLRQFSTEIPIVVLTGLDDREVGLSCVKHGAQDYLVKGKLSQDSLVRAISYSVERCRAEGAINKLKLLEQRENFIATLAHDLRNPIIGSDRIVSMLLETLSGSITHEQKYLLSMVSGANKTLLLMISNVLDSYRLEAGGEKFRITRVDLLPIMTKCLQDLEPIAQGKNIKVQIESTFEHDVYADAMAMQRVIVNLVSNAIKYTPDGGTVEVIFTEQACRASLKVRDNGIGIEDDKQPFLFQRFYQTDCQNRGAGLGLGLHLCKQLMDAQNGSIGCTSKTKEGSTFEVTLPIAYKQSIKALIVDDDAANSMALKYMLKRFSVESVSVSNGMEALRASSNHSFGAVFMDIQMPGLDGFNTSKAMRDAGFYAPIVAYTVSNDCARERFEDAGMSDILEKPIVLERVKEVIDQWLPSSSPS